MGIELDRSDAKIELICQREVVIIGSQLGVISLHSGRLMKPNCATQPIR